MAATVLLAACTAETEVTEDQDVAPEVVAYTLDAENSSIEWKGMMSPEYFHVGTIMASEGSIEMTDGEFSGGSMTIDMTSIKNTDLEEEKGTYLVGHLQGTMPDEDHPVDMFFNTPAHPEATVTLGEYNDGKLSVTFNVVGKEFTQDVDVAMKSDDNGASIGGNFSVDMSSLMLPGLQPNPETGEGINPSVEFTIDLAFKK